MRCWFYWRLFVIKPRWNFWDFWNFCFIQYSWNSWSKIQNKNKEPPWNKNRGKPPVNSKTYKTKNMQLITDKQNYLEKQWNQTCILKLKAGLHLRALRSLLWLQSFLLVEKITSCARFNFFSKRALITSDCANRIASFFFRPVAWKLFSKKSDRSARKWRPALTNIKIFHLRAKQGWTGQQRSNNGGILGLDDQKLRWIFETIGISNTVDIFHDIPVITHLFIGIDYLVQEIFIPFDWSSFWISHFSLVFSIFFISIFHLKR